MNAIERWNALLHKIETTTYAVLDEGHRGCFELGISEAGTVAMSNAWQGIRSEVFALVEKISQLWSDKVEAALQEEGLDSAALLEHETRGRQLTRQLLHQLERHEVVTFGTVAQALVDRARASQSRTFRCTHCGSPLVIPARVFRSLHLQCRHCSTLNTFEPGSELRHIENFCGHHLSQHAALAEWEAMKAAQDFRRDTRGETKEAQRRIKESTERYWRAYYTARAELIPDFAKDVERDVAARVRLDLPLSED